MAWTDVGTFAVGQVLDAATMNALRGNQNIGHRVCTSITRPSAPDEGTMIYETDTKKVYVWNGSSWVSVYPAASPTITSTLPSSPSTGDEIIYKHGGTGNIGSHLPMIYDGTKWQPMGEAILAWWPSGGGQTFSSTTPTALNVGTYNTQTFTPPWSGYYEITARVEHATLTTGIGMYYALRSTDGAENYTLNYVQDVNGYTYHTSFGFPNPVVGYLNSAKTYRFYGWITYPFGNTGYMNFARAHIKAVAG